MKRKPTQYDFQSFLYNLGFRFYETGTMKSKDNKKHGVYWKCDSLSDDQKQKIVDKFGKWVEFYKSQAQYAPEIVKSIILLKSAN